MAQETQEITAESFLPFRGQTALIHRRMQVAAESGYEVVVSSACLFSSSHNNLERAGLRPACFGSSWRDFKAL